MSLYPAGAEAQASMRGDKIARTEEEPKGRSVPPFPPNSRNVALIGPGCAATP